MRKKLLSMSNSELLQLPYLLAAQNQKHITMNESLSKLDIIVQLSAINDVELSQPSNPTEGDRYIIPLGATGEWSGQEYKIAHYQDGAWKLITAQNGWSCWLQSTQKLYVYNGTDWQIYMALKSILSPDVIICEEVVALQMSTNAPVTGWNQRYLNLIKQNNLGAAVVLEQNSSRFKLPIGSYWVKIMASAMRVGAHKVDLKI